VRLLRSGDFQGGWLSGTPPERQPESEIRALATLVEAVLNASADVGSIPTVSITPEKWLARAFFDRKGASSNSSAGLLLLSKAQVRAAPRCELGGTSVGTNCASPLLGLIRWGDSATMLRGQAQSHEIDWSRGVS
jgi:hypothetical protein